MKIFESASKYNKELHQYKEYPKADERCAYERLPKAVRDELVCEGEKYIGYKFPAILASDYMEFLRSGDRVKFEDIYFEKRHALVSLILAECVEYKGRFADDIVNGIFSLCEESGWQLPAHNAYVRDTPQLILPDSDRPIIDLFAAETGAILAWAYYLLKKTLDNISPFIRKRIASELKKRIYIPYTEYHFWWMGKGDERMCNWTPWCTQNVLLSVFLVSDDPVLLNKVFVQASKSLDYFIKDYGEDGCCDEGAGYYRHAGLCLFGALNILNHISDGAFDNIFRNEKIKNIAAYILNVHAAEDYYFNFADCAARAGQCGIREYLFGKAVDAPALCALAADDFRKTACLYSGENNLRNIYYLLMASFNYNEIMNYTKQKRSDLKEPDHNTGMNDISYESVGLFIMRSDSFSLAVKAGNNNDNHNHNDTGSFILYKNGMPLFVDIGVESYTKKTFSDKRYEIWTMQSCYHNLPTIEGHNQNPGEAYHAADVMHSFTGGVSEISMELINAYPIYSGSYKRKIVLDRPNSQVMLTDITTCTEAILNFIIFEEPVISENTFTLGSHTICTFDGAKFLALETLPITDARLKKSWDHDLYRLRLSFIGNSSNGGKTFNLYIS